MTDRDGRTPRDRRQAGRAPAAALSFAAVAFTVVLVALAARVRDGQDPALRANRPPALPPRRVLIRRVLERRVVVHVPADAIAPAPSASQQTSAAGQFAEGAPLARAS
jgi:hypothetical protein